VHNLVAFQRNAKIIPTMCGRDRRSSSKGNCEQTPGRQKSGETEIKKEVVVVK